MAEAQIRAALVTGGARGIGLAIAARLAREGHSVALADVLEEEAARAAENLAAETGVKALGLKMDVTDPESVEAGVEKVVSGLGSLDILVNNAGITRDQLFMRMSPEDWSLVLKVNLDGAFNCCKAALNRKRPMMRNHWGRIVNITSIIGVVGNAGQANYAASKAGLIGLTRSLAKEYGVRNITVNAVAPGFIRTPMTDKLPEKVKEEYLRTIPAGRFGTPEDVAAAVAFFASPEAGYINGHVLRVDGGMF